MSSPNLGPDPGERPLTADRRRQLLDRVYVRGTRLRRRRRLVLAGSGGATAVAVTVLILAIVLPGGANEEGLRVAGLPESTTTSESTTTTLPTTTTTALSPSTVPVQTTIRVQPPPASPPSTLPTTTTIPPWCRNSFDPLCGPFRWDPAPDVNDPFKVVVVAAQSGGDPPQTDESTPEQPGPYEFIAGEKAWMAFRTIDPDALPNCARIDWGDGGVWSIGNGCSQAELENPIRPGCTRVAYGPWTPTEGFVRELIIGGNAEQPHTYEKSGVYKVRVRVASFVYPWWGEDGFPGVADGKCHDPYRSIADVEFTVTVRTQASL